MFILPNPLVSRLILPNAQDLYPPFCIASSGPDLERLPTASTCMNLLKLPDFKVRYVQYTICAGMVWVTILSSSVYKKSNGNSIIY